MEIKTFLRYWQQVRRLTVRLLDEFPADSFDFRPAPEVMTVSQMFKHILHVEIFIRNGFLDQTWENPDDPAVNMFEKDTLKHLLQREMQKTIELLSEVPEGKFISEFKSPYGILSGELLLMVAVDEEIHHRGNLYTYLRCMGKTPPQMIQHYDEILKENKDV